MKITNVNTYLVRPRWGFVEIETDEGITGWGDGTGLRRGNEAVPYRRRSHADRGHLDGSLPGRLLPRRPDPYERHRRH